MTQTLPQGIVVEMAKPQHRLGHMLWHGIRENWLRSQALRQAVLSIDPSWEPPRPARDASGQVLRDNGSGEDFLFMHRTMIEKVNSLLAHIGDPLYTKVEGWIDLPRPGDLEYPVPVLSNPSHPSLAIFRRVKSDQFFAQEMEPQERTFKDRAYLQSVTLGQLGADIEFSIHGGMHLRWAEDPLTIETRPVGSRDTAILNRVNPARRDPRWDAPSYDWLADTYSSHVSPVFWKIHGWIDNRIEDWMQANGHTEIQWVGTWLGPMSHEMASGDDGAVHEGPHLPTDGTLSVPIHERSPQVEAVTDILFDELGFDGLFHLAEV